MGNACAAEQQTQKELSVTDEEFPPLPSPSKPTGPVATPGAAAPTPAAVASGADAGGALSAPELVAEEDVVVEPYVLVSDAIKELEAAAVGGLAHDMLQQVGRRNEAAVYKVAVQPLRAALLTLRASEDASVVTSLRTDMLKTGIVHALLVQLGSLLDVREQHEKTTFAADLASSEIQLALKNYIDARNAADAATAKRSEVFAAKAKQDNKTERIYGFAKGTGYGMDDDGSYYDDGDTSAPAMIHIGSVVARAQRVQADKQAALLLSLVAEVAVDEAAHPIIKASCLCPALRNLFLGSDIDVEQRLAVYHAAVSMAAALSVVFEEALTSPLDESNPHSRVADAAKRLYEQQKDSIDSLLEPGASPGAAAVAGSDDEHEGLSGESMESLRTVASLARDCVPTEVSPAAETGAGGAGVGPAASAAVDGGEGEGEAELYMRELSPLLFGASHGLAARHKFSSAAATSDAASGRARMKRVMRELRHLKRNMPADFASSVFLRYDKEKPFLMQALVVGPQDTPYADGLYLFDIHCHERYPHQAPTCEITSNKGGSHGWGPNLYSCGKVCLSLLGTWGGQSEEGWTKDSTLLQLIISLQALVLGNPEPYYNEPGCEGSRDDDQSRTQSCAAGGWEQVRESNLVEAIAGMITSPPAGFEEVVRKHFFHRRKHLAALMATWGEHAASAEAKDSGHAGRFKAARDVATAALDSLTLGHTEASTKHLTADASVEREVDKPTGSSVDVDTHHRVVSAAAAHEAAAVEDNPALES